MPHDIRSVNPDFDFDKMEAYILSLSPSTLKLDTSLSFNSDPKEGLLDILRQGRYSDSINPDTGKKYCGGYQHRSITDIFRLCKHYYPSVTLVEVYNLLINYLGSDTRSWICKDTRMRTWDNAGSAGFNSAPIDEYGVKYSTSLNKYYGYGVANGESELNFVEQDFKLNK